jgi:hypothetical protein
MSHAEPVFGVSRCFGAWVMGVGVGAGVGESESEVTF